MYPEIKPSNSIFSVLYKGRGGKSAPRTGAALLHEGPGSPEKRTAPASETAQAETFLLSDLQDKFDRQRAARQAAFDEENKKNRHLF